MASDVASLDIGGTGTVLPHRGDGVRLDVRHEVPVHAGMRARKPRRRPVVSAHLGSEYLVAEIDDAGDGPALRGKRWAYGQGVRATRGRFAPPIPMMPADSLPQVILD